MTDVPPGPAALRRFAPLCCFITRGELQAIYDETIPEQGLEG